MCIPVFVLVIFMYFPMAVIYPTGIILLADFLLITFLHGYILVLYLTVSENVNWK